MISLGREDRLRETKLTQFGFDMKGSKKVKI
jgi:hypothetical protein